MRLLFLLAVLSCLTLVGCNLLSNDGRYVIYKVDKDDYGNDTITNYLANSLQGNYYQVKFQDDFVSVYSEKNKQDMLLAKSKGNAEHPVYSLHAVKDGADYLVIMKKDDDLTISVDLSVPKDKMILVPVQLGDGRHFNHKFGTVTCHLSKVK